MSTYGLRVKDAAGNIILDHVDEISRFRYSNLVNAGVSDSVVLSDIAGLNSVEFPVSVEITTDFHDVKCSHLVSRSGTTISWIARDGETYNSAQSIVFVFLYT